MQVRQMVAADKEMLSRASLYELLAMAFRYPDEALAGAVASGEFADACAEVCAANGIEEDSSLEIAGALRQYVGKESCEILHDLRREHTRLFIGKGKTLVTPYAGVWKSIKEGKQPLYMVGEESMDIERFMRRCGMGQPEGTNEPLDHISSLLEFLYYLCAVRVRAVAPPEYADVHDDDYEVFFSKHFDAFRHAFSEAVVRQSREPFFTVSAQLLKWVSM